MQSTFAPQTGRLDRHVRRSVLRIGEGASRHRIAYSLEEALRLATLPGEEEGRVYSFRRVSLSGVPAEANRRVWMEQVQRVLGELAVQSIHASDPRAAAANAVYFNNFEEALETLLRNAVRATGGARVATPEWFANSAIGLAPESGYSAQIPAILERLRPPSMAPAAAASILFAALGNADPVGLLTAIPIITIREWLHELAGQASLSASLPPVQLPSEMKIALQRSASHFGWKDPATIWLAAQAVLALSPGTWSSGTVVKRARATLRTLEEEQTSEPRDRSAATLRGSGARQLVFDNDDETTLRSHSRGARPADPARQNEMKLSRSRAQAGEEYAPETASEAEEITAESESTAIEPPESPPARQPLLGEATHSAGLYFLLNVLRTLGIAAALETNPALAEADLATRILRRLATEAGVASNDPIMLCLHPTQDAFVLTDEVLADLSLQPDTWPRGFASLRHAQFDSSFFLRAWTVATKRWCWRMGRITLDEIVHRDGRVWLTRADLDVTFPLASADLRIRRIGLDIDPGWLPWFGECGRVVHFHYSDRQSEEPA
jgi:hypothetical protein